MPTCGVNLENMEKWFNHGVSAVGIGGNLIAPAKTDDFEKITHLTKQYMDKLNAISGNHFIET